MNPMQKAVDYQRKNAHKIERFKRDLQAGLCEFNPMPHISETNGNWFDVYTEYGQFRITVEIKDAHE